MVSTTTRRHVTTKPPPNLPGSARSIGSTNIARLERRPVGYGAPHLRMPVGKSEIGAPNLTASKAFVAQALQSVLRNMDIAASF